MPVLLILMACLYSAAFAMQLDPWDPYYPGVAYPKLTTPQWYGEAGVDAVVMLSIDDMREPEKYEAFIRPIVDRLKQIDGRAGMSIMTNLVPPQHPQLRAWLAEGLSIECHTRDHPCPLLGGKPLSWSKDTYDACVDNMASIPGNVPVAFRMPCCDSKNTVSPRFFSEIFAKPTPAGNYLQIDSSVFNITTPNDPILPRALVFDKDGREKFRKYLPFPNFVNTIEDYPYPYLIGGVCWEFPCAVPSDWEAQNINKPFAEQSLDDMKAALDTAVLKQGVYTLVFHPHGWIQNTQAVELIDHVVNTYGRRVRFISFREAAEKLNQLLRGEDLRQSEGRVQLADLNGDGFQDVLLEKECRVWDRASRSWRNLPLPPMASTPKVGPLGRLFAGDGGLKAWQLEESEWVPRPELEMKETLQDFEVLDIDGDGAVEPLALGAKGPILYTMRGDGWQPWPCAWPRDVPLDFGQDSGLRIHDLDSDGDLDLLLSSGETQGLWLFANPKVGWVKYPIEDLPAFAQDGQNNGAFFHSRAIWWQNEDTDKLPDVVDKRSFNDLLKDVAPGPVPALHACDTMQAPPGFQVELVASEPLIQDPVSIAWGADGAMWVVEMRDYPEGLDGKGQPGSRVVKLVDVDRDGLMDQSIVFADGLAFADGCMPWRDGVLITAAPFIYFARDTNGDGKADDMEKLFTGFGEGNQQHRVNGPRWGLDNWVYCANGEADGAIRSRKTKQHLSISGLDFRFRPDSGEMSSASGPTQFGRVMNDYGEWFGCANWSPGWHYVLDEQALARNPDFAAPDTKHDLREDTEVHPISRAIKRFNDFHMANHFTSACGIDIYRDDLLGFRGDLFTCEPVHNLVARTVLTPDGATYSGARPKEDQGREFLSSMDNWFRPVMARTGPDGALYVVDMYRQQIEHPAYINAEDQARSDFRAGEDKGRIYRVYPVATRPMPFQSLAMADTPALVEALVSSNGPTADMAHQLLFERKPGDAPALLRAQLRHSAPWARLHVLGALEGLSAATDEDLAIALQDEHPAVRCFALRQAANRESFPKALEAAVVTLSADSDPMVRIAAAYALGHVDSAPAHEALAAMIGANTGDEHVLAAALSSVNPANFAHVAPAIVALLASESGLAPSAGAMAARMAARDGVTLELYCRLLAAATPGPWRFHAMHEVLTAVDAGALPPGGNAVIQEARALASQEDSDASLRAATLAVLGESEEDQVLLLSLVDARLPEPVVDAALTRLSEVLPDEKQPALLQQWDAFTPDLRRRVAEGVLDSTSGTGALLDALEAGTVHPRQIDLAQRQRLLRSKKDGVAGRAEKIFASMGNSNRAAVLEQFRPAAALQGDGTHGQAIFTERCAGCHQLADMGHPVGPSLAAVADRSFEALATAILDPNRAVEERYTGYTVDTNDFNSYTGVVVAESANSITLASQNGIETTLLRSDIADMRASELSIMPEGLEENLTLQDFADLLAFVAGSGLPPKQVAGNQPAVVEPGTDGALALSAANAELYGPGITYSPEYRNLANWSSREDFAVWEIEVKEAGAYEIDMEYCCDNNSAGNRYLVQVAGQSITGQVPGTGTWNNYEVLPLGEVTLSAGKARLSFRPEGAPSGTLIELRALKLRKK